eukprot:scaffold205378_cov20-Prasinocladus_malaysianus.AAC.1
MHRKDGGLYVGTVSKSQATIASRYPLRVAPSIVNTYVNNTDTHTTLQRDDTPNARARDRCRQDTSLKPTAHRRRATHPSHAPPRQTTYARLFRTRLDLTFSPETDRDRKPRGGKQDETSGYRISWEIYSFEK